MDTQKKARIFISYKRVDKDRVFAIKDGIKKATGEECWIDLDGIESADQFSNVIVKAINRCEVFLFMYSKEHAKINDFEEDWTIKEITFAKEKKKRIVIVNIDDTPLIDQFLFEFPRKQRVDASDASALARLYKDLCSWLKIDITKTETKFPIFFPEYDGPVIHIFFLVDCSGSMYGRRMYEVNYACSEVLRNLSIINPDVEIKINVLCFESEVYWISDTPSSIDEFCWQQLSVGGLSNFGGACVELNQKLSKDEFFAPYYSSGRDVMNSLIILMTDSEPTDDYRIPLEELQKNSHFRHSNRFAIGLGNCCNQSILETFAGKKKVFIIPDEEEKLGLKPMLERILNMGLYAGSCAMLDDE